MLRFPSFAFGILFVSALAFATDPGVPPRPSSGDYPVDGHTDAAAIAAEIMPINRVEKMFSPEIARQYVVIEVAIYPDNGVPFEVRNSDFGLRVGQHTTRADRPIDVAPWPETRGGIRSPIDVTTETGVIYQRSDDPVYGRRQGVGTYNGVGVSAPGQDPLPPPPDPRLDPRVIADKAQRFALPEGTAKSAIAGYLYFPRYEKKKKSDSIELKYARDDVEVNLKFPALPK